MTPVSVTAAPDSLASIPHCKLLVVKVASRCNLNCSYCYVYNAGDTTYLRQPAVMSQETALAVIERAASHYIHHQLESFVFVFHGGEPLLAGKQFIRFFVEEARRRFPKGTD